ncbi:hypothetical protein O3M35_012281 [Rhynocoris fuscipes]|uniref:Major facilitator superfamily (MFS) profile domain-containing protein n=1 Tax=Rhynocoris fuscipes TaxID=488301 RepID=A0AAW1CYA7_9HEMI
MEVEGKEQSFDDGQGSRMRLYLAVISVNLLFLCAGTVGAWISPTIANLQASLSNDQIALVGSLFSFGAAFGPIIAAFSLDSIGRKGTLYILGACYLISWIILASSINVYVLYIGRIIGGIGVGGTFSCGTLFVAEIADSRSRGPAGSMIMLSSAIGILMEYSIGPWTSYLTLVIVSAVPAILFFFTFIFIPESPYYLLIKNRKSEAAESLRWFRGNIPSSSVQKELNEIEDGIKQTQTNKVGIKSLLRRGPAQALIISLYLLILQQGSGNAAVISYAQYIFELSNVTISSSICAIIGGITIFSASIFTPFIVRKFSMKRTLLSSTAFVAISLGVLAVYFHLQSRGYDVSNLSYIPILAYMSYNIFFCWGCGPLPWAMVAELLPTEVKGISTCICGIISSLTAFAIIEITGILLPTVGVAIVLTGFCIFLTIITIGGVYLIPETNGMSLPEIHQYLATGKRPQKSLEPEKS